MRCRSKYAGGITLLLSLGCGAHVDIGQGGAGASAGGPTSANGGAGAMGTGAVGTGAVGAGAASSEGGESPGVGAATNGGAAPEAPQVPRDDGPQREATKLDLLLAVDNSISMADKQLLFSQTLPELIERLINPPCVDAAGVVTSQPASPQAACPGSSQREIEPLRDVHVGVISSSLGAHGASGSKDVCVTAEDDDHAHLIPTLRAVDSYADRGFLKWDPDGLASPPGESDVQAFTDSLQAVLGSVGESGCGFEAQLESVYRFLVDPEPPLSIARDAQSAIAVKQGRDTSLLEQRRSFLRPDSSVAVLLLTDENDCSVLDEGYGWLVNRTARMYAANSICASDPNDRCCRSCGEAATLDGCPSLADDPACQNDFLVEEDDDLNLRCWEQKRRFGLDLLYPISRYVRGFGDGMVPDRNGSYVQNPLFHRDGVDRDRSLFTLAVVGGVPWQDLATPESLAGEELRYMSPAELEAADRFQLFLGDPAAHVPAADPFMVESTAPRSGANPLTDAPVVAPSSTDPRANDINGHEHLDEGRDLQYACTFELPEPRACDQQTLDNGEGCDCFAGEAASNRSVCQPPGGGPTGTTQYYGKAYPSLRELAVARDLGRRSVLGSVCARNTTDPSRDDYGYRPVFSALSQRIAKTLAKPR